MISKKYLLLISGIIIIGAIFLFLNQKTLPPPVLRLPNKDISIIVVDTPETMQKGLGGRELLSGDEGMLFIFAKPELHGIWMKDMKFAIDIIWIDEEYKIVHIESNVSPQTYPKTFWPLAKSLYVLETKAGFALENELKVGDILNFDLIK